MSFFYAGQLDQAIADTERTLNDYHLEPLESLVSGNDYRQSWKCPDCNNINYLYDTKINRDVLANPSFINVVPLPPTRKNGLMGRSQFRQGFVLWAWNMINELEERMAQFRDDNWSKDDDYIEDEDIVALEEE